MAHAAKHVGPGYRSTGGYVTVPGLDWGAGTALACQPRRKTATISNVQVGKYVYGLLPNIFPRLVKFNKF